MLGIVDDGYTWKKSRVLPTKERNACAAEPWKESVDMVKFARADFVSPHAEAFSRFHVRRMLHAGQYETFVGLDCLWAYQVDFDILTLISTAEVYQWSENLSCNNIEQP